MSNPYANYSVIDLLPHKPPMILLDRVVNFGEDFIQTSLTIHKGVPFFKKEGVPAYVAIEYMAQTVGVWSGLTARQYNLPPKIGFLLGTRKLTLQIPFFKDGAELIVYGNSKYNDGQMASFDCWVEVQGEKVASAILNVFQPDNVSELV